MQLQDRQFKISSVKKNKGYLKLCVLSLLLILLCSCNTNNGNVINDTEVVNKGDNISEDITNLNLEEVLAKVKDEIVILTGLADIDTSELFSFDNIYYINVNRSGDYYGIWRYENGDLKRILHKIEEVVNSRDDDKIIIDGPHNSYIIKLGTNNDGKKKVLYECYYTDILNSDNGDFTCYINDFFSVCVVDNNKNEIILNKYIDINNEFSKEDYILDNNRFFTPTRMQIMETGWIKNSNMAYFACYDMSNIFFVIDIDKKAVFQPNSATGAGIEDFIDKNNGYIVSGDTTHALDIDTYMIKQMKKQYNRFYLINLFTLKKFEIAKSINEKIKPQIENDKTISYIASSGERVKVDISDMIGKDSSHITGFKDRLYSELSIDDDNVSFHKFNNSTYAVIDDGENKKLVQNTDDNKLNIIADKLNDINFSELGKYISLYNKNGDIIVLDKNGNKYLEDNVFKYISNNDTAIELGVTIWGKNNDILYILTKKGDNLSNIFEVNMIDKSIKDLAFDIDCRYENLYIDILEGYVVYSTFPGPIFYSYDKEVNDDVFIYVKYLSTGEKTEIARVKGASILFYIFNNELELYCRENDDIKGTYNLIGDVPVSLSQEQEDTSPDQQLLLNGISLTKDIIYSVYRGEENYRYEVLLFALAINDDENNLYKGYFPFDENKGGFTFPLNKSNEVMIQVFGEKEYPSFEEVFDYDKESDTYYKNLDFGWNTAYRAENVTAEISDDKLKLYTQFQLINQWYDVGGDPVPTAIAECKITYSIISSNDRTYLQFKNMEIVNKLVN